MLMGIDMWFMGGSLNKKTREEEFEVDVWMCGCEAGTVKCIIFMCMAILSVTFI
jgi:hypothetical protein